MYFRSRIKNATLMLEQGEESEELEVVREDEGFDLIRGYWNTASCVLQK